MSRIVAVIPARGGSKGIPRKNIRLLAGKPLIAYSIEASLRSRYMDRTIVSTDDEEIAQISKLCRAEVMERPKELARDDSPTIDVICHVLGILKEKESYNPNIVVLLQPTSPLRTTGDIDNAVELFLKSDCESLISVCEAKEFPYWMHRIEKGYLKPLMGLANYNKRRQDLPKTYFENGAIFMIKNESLYEYNNFFTGKTVPYLMPLERSIDIDDELDLKLAELLLAIRGKEK